jgi:hypothetical protein
MQFKKKILLAGQESSHTQSAIGHLDKSSGETFAPTTKEDDDATAFEHYLESKGIFVLDPEPITLSCQFVIPRVDIQQFNLATANGVAGLQKLTWDRANVALCEQHGPKMSYMLSAVNVTGFEEAHSAVIELDDGSVFVNHSVKPVYQLH